MNRHVSRGAAGTRALVRAWRSEQLTFIAASLAYYSFVSLFPLLLLAIVATSVFASPDLADSLADRAGTAIAPGAETLVETTLEEANGLGGVTIVGLGVLLWSGLKVFRGLDIAFSMVYGADYNESFLRQVRDALTALLAVGSGLAIVVVVGTVVAFAGVQVGGVLATPALVVGLVAALLPLYYLFPDTDVGLREALPGAAFAAVSWAVLGTVFRIYAGSSGTFTGYGIVGGVLILVTWFYFGSIVLLVGAVVNAVLAGRLSEDEIASEFPTRDSERLGEPPGPVRDDRHQSRGSIQGDREDRHAVTSPRRTDHREAVDTASGGPGGTGRAPERDDGSDDGSDVGGDESDVGSDDGSDVGGDESDVGGDDESDVGSDDESDVGSDEENDVGSDMESDVESDPENDARSDGSGRAAPAGISSDENTGEPAQVRDLRQQVRDLRADLGEFEEEVEERTIHRDEIERDLRRYVRRRVRRGHARGWGPYLVLLYGTAMTLGAFYYLGSGWAMLAMVVIWLSTLGLYALMLVVGAILGVAGLPRRLGGVLDRVRGRR